MWHCDVCDITIQEKGRPGHLKSKRHLSKVALQHQAKEKELEEVKEEKEVTKEENGIIEVSKKGKAKKSKKDKKNKTGELKIRIIDGDEKESKPKEDTLDRIITFVQDPKNQPIISIIGSVLQNILASKTQTPEKQEGKWGRDRDTGEIIEF